MAISAHFDSFEDTASDTTDFLADVKSGLSAQSKSLPCKYFYDEVGSQLFDRVCYVEDYYPTRTETTIMEAYAADMAKAIGPGAKLIEYGSGASKKVRVLLDALIKPAAYVAVDISKEFLLQSAEMLAADYPALNHHALCVDFTKPFSLPEDVIASGHRAVGFFPGSTIGNFTRDDAKDFLSGCAKTLGEGGGLLIGVDLKKDKKVLNAAYNDSDGITEAFNLNLLERINRELAGTFDLGCFAHLAFYNEDEGRMEMHLESLTEQTVQVGQNSFQFRKGERIHTESSYKYTIEEFQALAASSGFSAVSVWTDDNLLFSVHFLEVS